MKSFLSALREIDQTKDTLSRQQNSKSIDLHSGRIDAKDLQDHRPESSAVEKTNWPKFYRQFGAAGLISTAACFWQSTAVMAAPLSCSSIYADVNGGTAIYSINTSTAALTSAATLPVNSNVGIAAINVGGVPTVYSDSATASIHLNYTNGTTTGNNTAATFTNPYGGGLGADTAGRLFYIGNNGTTQSLMRFATTTSAATNIGTITSAIPNDTVWKNLSPGDMMSDANGRLYYFGSDYTLTGGLYTNYLYYVDANLVARRLGSYTSAQTGIGVAFDPSGTIYTLNRNLLYKIDLTAGFSSTLIGNTGNNQLIDMASCALPTMNPNVSGTKTVRDVTTNQNPATIVNTNDILEYNVVIKNTGNLPSDGSKFIDTIPPGSSYVASSTKLCNATGVTCATVADISGSGPFVGSGMLVNTLGQSSGIVLAGAANNAIVKFQVKVTSTGNPASIVNTGQISYPTVNGGTVTTNTPNTSNTSVPISVPFVTLSGNIFDDLDGSKVKAASGENYTAANITAVLLDASNKVVSTVAVNATGDYILNNVPAGTYSVKIIQTPATALTTGVVIPPANDILPTNWVATGENNNGTPDATVDRTQSVTVASANITNINFGIEQLPDTTALTPASQSNPGGSATVQVPTLAGTDPEDGALGSGKTFKIVTLPTNADLYYNGTKITTPNFVIANYDPTKLTVDPNDGAITVSFTYAAVDAASQQDPTPATVAMPFTSSSSPANLLLVKRITAINGTPLNVFKDDTEMLHAADDNNVNWPTPLNTNTALGDTTISTFLRGAIDAGKVKPGDTIEYTIYFLNAGGSNANNVRVCDRITGAQKFPSGSTIQLQQNSATPTTLTSIADADRATFYASSSNPAITNCNFTGTPTIDNGAIVVDATGATGSPTWTTLLGSTGPGTANTYGLVRFTTKVNP